VSVPSPTAPIDGDLGHTPFPEVVGILGSRLASGRLTVHGAVEHTLDFSGGWLVALDGRAVGDIDAASWVADAVLELCAVTAAPFRFERIDIDATGGISGDALLAGAERRVEQWREITRFVPSTNAIARLVTEAPPVPQIVIDARDWPVLSLIDGRRSVADVIVAVGGSPFDVCDTLAGLVVAGLVAVDYDEGPTTDS
jgi:hypothetical protein